MTTEYADKVIDEENRRERVAMFLDELQMMCRREIGEGWRDYFSTYTENQRTDRGREEYTTNVYA